MKWPRKIEMRLWWEDGKCEMFPTDEGWRSALEEYVVTVAGWPLSELTIEVGEAAEILREISDKEESTEEITSYSDGAISFSADPVLVVRWYVLHLERLIL